MSRYSYAALDSRGQESTGFVDASSTSEAIGQLRQAGYFPTNVCEEAMAAAPGGKATRPAPKVPRSGRVTRRRNVVLFQRKSVKPKTLMVFTRQLATLIDAGLPLLRSLNVLAKQERDSVLKSTINPVADSV